MAASLGFLGSTQFLLWLMVGIVIEALVLVLLHRRTARGPRPLEVCTFLGAGLAFVIALYAARAHAGASPTFITALSLALVFHVWHLSLLAHRNA
jgi:hypothetical protein